MTVDRGRKRKRDIAPPPTLPSDMRLLAKVGQGSYAAVYAARWKGKPYAVKISHVAGPAHAATLDTEADLQRTVFSAYAASGVPPIPGTVRLLPGAAQRQGRAIYRHVQALATR